MAKIHEEIIIIKFSKLVKDNEDAGQISISNPDVVDAITAVAQELAGAGTIVETEVAK